MFEKRCSYFNLRVWSTVSIAPHSDQINTSFTPNLVDSTADEGELLFADWQKALVLAYFGGVDILVDPYSSAGTAQINLHVNKFYDCEVQRAGAVARIFDFT